MDKTLDASTSTRWIPWVVAAIAAAAGGLYLLGAGDATLHNYYTPAVVAMSESWHSFIYGAFDTAAWSGVDKIPGSLWPQATSVAIFGPSTWSVVLPEVIATVATIVVIYFAAARWRGRIAGLAAAAVYATMPLAAALAKSNVPEVWFGLALAVAAYFMVRAIQSGRFWWLLGTGLAISAAFQVKMLEAWMIYPAIAISYLIAAQAKVITRIWHVLVAGLISIAASLWWIALVWVTPAASRPWVGGTSDDSPWSMVFGYNGFGRVTGGQGSFVANFAGDAGLARLIGPQVAVDVSWFLPLAALAAGIGVVIGLRKWSAGSDARSRLGGYLFFGLWLIPVALVMAYSAGIHTFYVLAFAPAIAFLIGGMTAELVDSISSMRVRCAAAMVIAAQAAWIALLVIRSGESAWLILVTTVITLSGIALLITGSRSGVIVAMLAMLIAPTTWAIGTIHGGNSINPSAGSGFGMGPGGGQAPNGMRPPGGAQPPTVDRGGSPASGFGGGHGGPSGPGGATTFNDASAVALGEWLQQHSADSQYLVAADSRTASSLILAEIPGVLTLGGGFNGSDPTPTAGELQQLVGQGNLRYVIVSQEGGIAGPGGFGGGPSDGQGGGPGGVTNAATQKVTQERSAWITDHCTAVTDGPTTQGTLYDCAP